MATKKRKSPGTKNSTPARKKFGKKVYTKSACSMTKTDAKKKAASVRKSGRLARIVKSSTGKHCVYTAGPAKAAVGKRRKSKKK